MDRITVAVIVCGIINIGLFTSIGKLLFGSWADFWDAFCLSQDIDWGYTGEYRENERDQLKLVLFAVICLICIFGELWLAMNLFGNSGVK